jgi:hypothetical protein
MCLVICLNYFGERSISGGQHERIQPKEDGLKYSLGLCLFVLLTPNQFRLNEIF